MHKLYIWFILEVATLEVILLQGTPPSPPPHCYDIISLRQVVLHTSLA
jgi:hypothetical protein